MKFFWPSLSVFAVCSSSILAGHSAHALGANDSFFLGTYPDTGSGDWVSGWAESVFLSSVADTTLSDTNLTTASGNYLNAVTTSNGTAIEQLGGVSRQLNETGPTPESLRISFLFRVDQLPDEFGAGNETANRGNRFHIAGDSRSIPGTSSTSTWMIFASSNAFGVSTPGAQWLLHNGQMDGNFNDGGQGENAFVQTGIPVIEGHTYRMTVIDDRAGMSYSAIIDDLDDAGGAFRSGTLGYRNGTAFTDPFLKFIASIRDTDESTDSAGFSIDNISVASLSPADLSADGDIDDEDLGLFFSAFTGPDSGPSSNPAADLSGDGDVDDEDLGLAFSEFTGPLVPVVVPEPASVMMLMFGALAGVRRRRR